MCVCGAGKRDRRVINWEEKCFTQSRSRCSVGRNGPFKKWLVLYRRFFFTSFLRPTINSRGKKKRYYNTIALLLFIYICVFARPNDEDAKFAREFFFPKLIRQFDCPIHRDRGDNNNRSDNLRCRRNKTLK